MKCPRCATELKMVEDQMTYQIFICEKCNLKVKCEEGVE